MTKLAPNGSLVSGITSSSDSGVLVDHIAVTKRSNFFFVYHCRIKRMCIVLGTSGDNMRTFPYLVEHETDLITGNPGSLCASRRY